MNNWNPKISVIMANYNCEKYLIESIDSILEQSFSDFEFIIIDDGSTDDSWIIIQDYAKKDNRIIAIKNKENLKVSKTRNKWLKIAKWEYIAIMDSDDVSYLDRFEKQINYLQKNPEAVIVWWTMDIMDEKWKIYSRRKYNLTDTLIRKKLFRYSPFCHATTMFRKDVIEKCWGYNIYLPEAEDYDLFFRIWLHWNFWNLEIPTYKMRVNSKWLTLTNTKRMELLTLFVRRKAVVEYWYKMSIWDKIYYILQMISIYLIPSRLKVWIFNLLRNN